MEAFNFTPEDLEANRSGRLTPAQAKRHRSVPAKTIIGCMGASLLGFGLPAIGLAYVGLSNGDMTVLFLAVVVGVFCLMGLRFGIRKFLFGSPNQPVTQVKGTVRLEHSSEPRQTGNTFEMHDTYTLRVNKLHFDLSEAQFGTLADGKIYVVYYVAGLEDVLVSIEEP